MELYVSGLKVPKLNSLNDRMARSYLLKRVGKEIALNKILAQIAIGVSEPGDKVWTRTITNLWGEYITKAYYMDSQEDESANDMAQEYKEWVNKKLKLEIQKDGSISLKGL